MRRRKRPEYRVRTYKYWARPTRDLPETFWELAHNMRETWNALVEAREKAEESSRKLAKDQQKALWSAHREACRKIVADSRLNWECGPEILDRFETACRLAASGQRGWPKRQHEVRSVLIPHYYTGGGVCPAALFRSNRRLSLRPVPEEAYANSKPEAVRGRLTRGTFGFAGGSIEFETILHRPLPPTAYIKRCAWTGKHHPIRGWRWFITVTVEEPPPPTHQSEKTVAVELGWRVLGDAIRVAVAVDQDGCAQELRLPLNAARAHERRHSLPSHWRDLALIDAEIGALLNKVRIELHSVFSASKTTMVDPLPTSQGALVQLMHSLDESGATPEGAAVLRRWKAQNDRLCSIRACLAERLIGRRRWLYRNFAARLCRNYRTIVLKNVAIQRLNQSGRELDAASPYRRWASPAELSLYIRQAAVGTGTTVQESESAFLTTTCAECGAQAIQTGYVMLTCSNGHTWDQDKNAARNLLSQLRSDSRQLNYLRTRWPQKLEKLPGRK